MIDQGAWANAITEPLGIVGFSLFLIFLLLSKTVTSERRWLMPVFVLLAIISLLGGLFISYEKDITDSDNTMTETQPSIKIETHGTNSPAIGVSHGDVNINNSTDTSND